MGCFWSREDRDRCIYCYRKGPVHNLIIIDNVCVECLNGLTRARREPIRVPATSYQLKPRFGEYRCSCGRTWSSRLSWARTYQICKSCRKPVHAHNQRDLRPSDLSDNRDKKEHQKEYCQMCQQLGYYCGNYGKKEGGRFDNSSRSKNYRKRY